MRDKRMVWGVYTHPRITKEKTIKDWFKYIRNWLRTMAWCVHVETDDLSIGWTTQMNDQNTELHYHNILQ